MGFDMPVSLSLPRSNTITAPSVRCWLAVSQGATMNRLVEKNLAGNIYSYGRSFPPRANQMIQNNGMAPDEWNDAPTTRDEGKWLTVSSSRGLLPSVAIVVAIAFLSLFSTCFKNTKQHPCFISPTSSRMSLQTCYIPSTCGASRMWKGYSLALR